MTQVETEGVIHPCNGYMLVQTQDVEHGGLIVVRDPDSKDYKSGIVIEMSGDNIDDVQIDNWEWKHGDLVFFSEVTEIDGHYFVHWTDVVAFRRF